MTYFYTQAQIGHGGVPYSFAASSLRNKANAVNFISMPAFDVQTAIEQTKENRSMMRGGYTFAHKFQTNIRKGIDGETLTLPDGSQLWRVGIQSEGAYSINLFFSKFHLPEGGKLFIYNAEHTDLIGAFDARNNNADRILPTRPVEGDRIVVEYYEPADAAFTAELEIGEVNHDYIDVLRAGEPSNSDIANDDYLCMQEAPCAADEKLTRSTLMYLVGGTTICSGSLVNNTAKDETPYLLTAIHCFNPTLTFPKTDTFYDNLTKTIVAFFNYERRFCGGDTVRPTEEMSLAIAHPVAMVEAKDVALLQFETPPPNYYNAYYAGWNAENDTMAPPFINIHHALGFPKKYGFYSGSLDLVTLRGDFPSFDAYSHRRVAQWTEGSTDGGSSGSPLFDNNQRIIGTLTSGNSYCPTNANYNPSSTSDFFTIFRLSYNHSTKPLKPYLNPTNDTAKVLDGFDPNFDNPIIRLSNANYSAGDTLGTTLHAAAPGTEYAEQFYVAHQSDLYGAYIYLPPMAYSATNGVKIKIYTDSLADENIIAEQVFLPKYLKYDGATFTPTNRTTTGSKTENFVVLDSAVSVKHTFFVSYEIPTGNTTFKVCNALFDTPKPNKAWVKNAIGEWSEAPFATSLAIQAVMQDANMVAMPKIEHHRQNTIRYERVSHTLVLPDGNSAAGRIYLYSSAGQLMRILPITSGQRTIRLAPTAAGQIGIARIVRGDEIYTGKFIY
jgi:hypothetical protein